METDRSPYKRSSPRLRRPRISGGATNRHVIWVLLYGVGGVATFEGIEIVAEGIPAAGTESDGVQVRVQIIRHARTHSVGKSQSCMF